MSAAYRPWLAMGRTGVSFLLVIQTRFAVRYEICCGIRTSEAAWAVRVETMCVRGSGTIG